MSFQEKTLSPLPPPPRYTPRNPQSSRRLHPSGSSREQIAASLKKRLFVPRQAGNAGDLITQHCSAGTARQKSLPRTQGKTRDSAACRAMQLHVAVVGKGTQMGPSLPKCRQPLAHRDRAQQPSAPQSPYGCHPLGAIGQDEPWDLHGTHAPARSCGDRQGLSPWLPLGIPILAPGSEELNSDAWQETGRENPKYASPSHGTWRQQSRCPAQSPGSQAAPRDERVQRALSHHWPGQPWCSASPLTRCV